ncbi:type II toxin-antitoxin system HicB family antitoxin [Xanthomonas cassavae CFBP 4642]|uniref:Type II toxin-antitoxin system HicB family antitoxin n=1 Tax=Xanthomonas cassavae CFBP 4642 TaxID=1219375 RepID=A0ABS8HHU7_9XANT|nr:Arc family DNA-binding protein [Xanthomonas cassavae]MCC4621769.1 type II toxin-antitoxin system HicB family antitoxin [Xanthomonas cassavae CFBP 4642]
MSEDGYTRITLRIPDGLHAKLTGEAARTSKSMNAEIVQRLESSFEAEPKNAQMSNDWRYVLLDLIEHGKVTSETLEKIKKNAGPQ